MSSIKVVHRKNRLRPSENDPFIHLFINVIPYNVENTINEFNSALSTLASQVNVTFSATSEIFPPILEHIKQINHQISEAVASLQKEFDILDKFELPSETLSRTSVSTEAPLRSPNTQPGFSELLDLSKTQKDIEAIRNATGTSGTLGTIGSVCDNLGDTTLGIAADRRHRVVKGCRRFCGTGCA